MDKFFFHPLNTKWFSSTYYIFKQNNNPSFFPRGVGWWGVPLEHASCTLEDTGKLRTNISETHKAHLNIIVQPNTCIYGFICIL